MSFEDLEDRAVQVITLLKHRKMRQQVLFRTGTLPGDTSDEEIFELRQMYQEIQHKSLLVRAERLIDIIRKDIEDVEGKSHTFRDPKAMAVTEKVLHNIRELMLGVKLRDPYILNDIGRTRDVYLFTDALDRLLEVVEFELERVNSAPSGHVYISPTELVFRDIGPIEEDFSHVYRGSSTYRSYRRRFSVMKD